MIAKRDDLARVQEIYDVVCQTLRQLAETGFDQARFVEPATAEDDLMAEGLANRVFRVAEEGGRLSEGFSAYGFPLREMAGMRNILAHAYGQVDRVIVWRVLTTDFPNLAAACERYCEDRGLALRESA